MDWRFWESATVATLHATAGTQGLLAIARGSSSMHKALRRVGGRRNRSGSINFRKHNRENEDSSEEKEGRSESAFLLKCRVNVLFC